MVKMVMLCGLSGAGKSLYAEELKEEGYIIHSSDKIREELGDVNDQSKNQEVFVTLHKRIKEDLRNGKNVVYDATNLSRKRRVAFLNELKYIPCERVCILVATPFEVCLEQNSKRNRIVPEEVLHRMYRSFQIPCVQEGFDDVIIHYPNKEWTEYYGDIITYVDSLCCFDQCNHHHALTLGEHMIKAADYMLHITGRHYNSAVLAAYSHDIGKVDTKEFKNAKGESTEEAHFLYHQNVGCYKSLFFSYPQYGDKQYIALLIELHMNPWLVWEQSEKAKQREFELFGSKVINDIIAIHESDLAAH